MKNMLDLGALVGNTPLFQITLKYKNNVRHIYAKAEYYNFSGSIKDRIAFYILNDALKSGAIKDDTVIIEATSGNTGISFAALSVAIGKRVTIFMPDWMSAERKALIRSYGADIILVSKEEGGFIGSVEKSKIYAKTISSAFLPSQFDNNNNVMSHYYTTAKEVESQLETLGLKISAFTAGVGTGGTAMGVGKYFKEIDPKIKIHPLEPSNSPTLRTGRKEGHHRLAGISDEFIPSIVQLDKLDSIIDVDDGDAIIMAQMLARKLGIGVGISSGANFLGAILAQEMIGGDAVSVTVFADDSKKYLSTDLMNIEPVKEGFISSEIELLDLKAIPCNSTR